MKKVLLSAMLFFALSFNADAQEVGVRWGNIGIDTNNFGLDAVISPGRFNRVHVDLSFGDDVGFDALFDFAYRPLGSSNINLYAGIGPSFSFGDPFWWGASGEIGAEYHFQGLPISIGADWRPTYWFEDQDGWGDNMGWGVNLRYVFGARNK